jgi:glucose/sorbosone dehydrogenase
MHLANIVRPSMALLLSLCALWTIRAAAQTPQTFPGLTIEIEDFIEMPITGKLVGAETPNESALSRVNAIREETGGSNRWFLPVVSGPVYIYDKKTKAFTTYLDFNGYGENRGLFKKFFTLSGYGNGINGFNLDPDYAKNGKFYTTHMEDPSIEASGVPQNAMFPGLQTKGYETTAPITTPGPVMHQGVLIEWTDSNPSNSTFEGTAREIFRVWLNTRSHQLGEVVFNPAARRGDPDWRVLYVDVGDGASGESRIVEIRPNPQRLDTMVGKIVRIIPDLNEHTSTSTVSENGRYRIPNDNPFAKTPGARKEIWAYGLRNPHRLTFAVDPANTANNRLIASICGLNTWEMISIIHKGANYGFPLREGNQAVTLDNGTTALPKDDRIPILIDATKSIGTVAPTYPVIIWGHDLRGGDCAGSGYLYNGKAVPALRGKFVYNDITTGRIWYSDYKDMLAADDGNPSTMARMHEVKILWNKNVYETMMPIVRTTFRQRGSKAENMNGKGRVSGERADVRIAVDEAGEMYVYSKSDGMIRRIVAAR